MGYRQAVRHWILTPASGGSNPPSPARNKPLLFSSGFFVIPNQIYYSVLENTRLLLVHSTIMKFFTNVVCFFNYVCTVAYVQKYV